MEHLTEVVTTGTEINSDIQETFVLAVLLDLDRALDIIVLVNLKGVLEVK
jgi:hypothetical protein